MRLRIIGAMNSPTRYWSPNGLSEEWCEPIGSVAYHMRELKALGWVEVKSTAKKRGAIEHFYGPTERTMAWGTQWHQLPLAAREHLAAFTLRLGIESLGAAIDDGAFESRDDTVVAQDTMKVDERGTREALAILKHATEALMMVGERAEARLAEQEEDGQLVSYFMGGYPGAIREL
jgi:hypothetical protein